MRITRTKEHWQILIAALLSGTIVAGGKFFSDRGLSLYEITLYRAFIAGIPLLPFIIQTKNYRTLFHKLSFFILFGFVAAVTILSEFASVILGVPVAAVALLLYIQPVWTTIFSKLLLKEAITKRKIFSLSIAVVGVVILLKPWDIASVGSPLAIAIGIVGGVFLSLWIVLGRKCGINKMHWATATFGSSMFSGAWVLLFYPLMAMLIDDQQLIRLSVGFPFDLWMYFILFVIVSDTFVTLLLMKGMHKVSASIAGMILLIEPLSAAVLAAIFLRQPITSNIVMGGLCILFANYLVIEKQPIIVPAL